MTPEGFEPPVAETPSIGKSVWQKPMVATLDTWEAEGVDGSGADAGLNS